MSILTYQDVVEYLITSSAGGAQDAEQKDIRTAVQNAYKELVWIKDWKFHITYGRIITQANWTGTASYVNSTRTLTKVSGANFESWMRYGTVVFGNVVSKITSVNSTSALTLDSVLNFGKDYSTTAANIARSMYPLPADFRNLDTPMDEGNLLQSRYVSPEQSLQMERTDISPISPFFWTVMKDPDSVNGWVLKILGYPTTQATIDFSYRRSPRMLRLSGHEASSRVGTIAVSGTACTGTGTTFTDAMVGSVLRIGTSSNYPDCLGSMNPWQYESKIVSRSSNTAIVLADSLTVSAGTKYVVTDPVDVAEGMQNCVLAASSYWLDRIRGAKPDVSFQQYQRDLKLAMENDVLEPLSGRRDLLFNSLGWRSVLKADQGTD